MADIDPGDLKIRSKLADLYTRDGNTGKAVDEHVAIAEELNKKGHLAEALQVLEKGLKIDPKSDRLRPELAPRPPRPEELRQGRPLPGGGGHAGAQRHRSCWRGWARPTWARKKIEEAEAIFKRLLELDPDDEESRVQMGRVYLHAGTASTGPSTSSCPWSSKLLARREEATRRPRCCSRSSRRTRPT